MAMTIPLSEEQFMLLTKLAFDWDISPQEALTRCLRQAHESHEAAAGA